MTTKTIVTAADIREIFEGHARVQAPVAAMDEETLFLPRLLPGAASFARVRNSFHGFWRLQRFLRDVQWRAAVCLAEDADAHDWSYRGLAEEVNARRAQPSAQLQTVRLREARARQRVLDAGVKAVLFLSVPLGVLFVYALDAPAARAAGLCIAAAPASVVLWHCIQQWLFYRRLSERIAAGKEVNS